jgi:predicted RecB family nuclease
MHLSSETLRLSPSDLSGFLTCRHRLALDLSAIRGGIDKPRLMDPYAAILARHGAEHEQRYVASLRAEGLTVINAKPEDRTAADDALRRTLEAMQSGVDVIVQARLEAGNLAGYADILRKVPIKSDLGDWSYEAHDTKLTRETKGGTILQLSAYSHMLAEMQGRMPDAFYVVTPIATERYLLADYAAYYRLIRRTLDRELAKGHEQLLAEYYPEPVEACQMCAWDARCEKRRRDDDHLSYIAGSSRAHRVELVAQGVPTLAAAAQMPVPVAFKPARGARETYDRLGHQARVQHQERTEHRPIVEQLPIEPLKGFCRLPAPSDRDVFLDLEGASFAREGGREYLIGLYTADGKYSARWAFDDQQEKRAFEDVIDMLTEAANADPGMHIYHFNHYETTAFKKLASRYVTRVDELDALLSAERFVDLYPIVRQAVRAGVESYSIKKLEQYYDFKRNVDLKNAHAPLLAIEIALDAKAPEAITDEIRTAVQGYNEDDCRSTLALRDWLETLRSAAIADGKDVPRPIVEEKERSADFKELQLRAQAVRRRLLEGLPPEAAQAGHPEHHLWLLAYLVDWHKREINAEWWEFFRLRDLPEEDLFDERKAIAGLAFQDRVEVVRNKKTQRPTGSVVDRYSYPPQDVELRGKLFVQTGKQFGTIEKHDRQARTIDIRKGPKQAEIHPSAIYSADIVNNSVLQESIVQVAESVLDTQSFEQCGMQLLQSRSPRLTSGTFGVREGVLAQKYAIQISVDLDRTVLPIQGPPGAGKTFIGAEMIRALVAAGKKVGVTANSHKVVHNLLDEVAKQAAKERQKLRLGAKTREKGDPDAAEGVTEFNENDEALAALSGGEIDVLGGTAWLWASEEAAQTADVLFVDEAGQMSLANVLAVSRAANSLALLGDPQQLDQPEKGTHPDGVGASALEHVLGGHQTMPPEKGIFLPTTWRMSPTLTAFTSELFYERKLTAKKGLENQALHGAESFEGSKLWFVPVEHDGNQSASDEEVEVVASLVDKLLSNGSMWMDESCASHQLSADDIRVVAPFNAQVNRLAERLGPRGVPVGTVDKFQGQTCAVVIYSMATSRPEDAPRGLEFLYSLNRLNVATSRARCAVFIVASPRLFEPECRTPRQMKLANALCRYVELAIPYKRQNGRLSES